MLNPISAKYFLWDMKMYLQFISFPPYWLNTCFLFFLVYNKKLTILHSRKCGCWCPNDARSQDIGNNYVYDVEPELFGPHMLRVDKYTLS